MPGVIPYPALPLAVAVEPRPGWAASADLMEAPPLLPEESSLEPGLVPATGEELTLQSAPGPLLEPGIIPPALLLPPEVVFPPLFDLLPFYSSIIYSRPPRQD